MLLAEESLKIVRQKTWFALAMYFALDMYSRIPEEPDEASRVLKGCLHCCTVHCYPVCSGSSRPRCKGGGADSKPQEAIQSWLPDLVSHGPCLSLGSKRVPKQRNKDRCVPFGFVSLLTVTVSLGERK